MRVDVNICCWNVGWGEATVIGFNFIQAHVVDFGTNITLMRRDKELICRAIEKAHYALKRYPHMSVVLTHLHYDHYSLMPHVLDNRQADVMYYPGIPEPHDLQRMVLYMLSSEAVILKRSGVMVFDDLAKKVKQSRPLFKGMKVKLTGECIYFEVLWPPLKLPPNLANKVRSKLKPVYEKAKKLVEKEGIEREVRELYEVYQKNFTKYVEGELPSEALYGLPTFTNLRASVEASAKLTKEEAKVLSEIHDAVNDFSLIVKYYNWEHAPLVLILGDNSQSTLDYLACIEPGGFVFFMRGAHHGLESGNFIRRHKALVTWLSWTSHLAKYGLPHLDYMYVSHSVMIAENSKSLSVYLRPLALWRRLHYCFKVNNDSISIYIP